jgi:hypothetical protein
LDGRTRGVVANQKIKEFQTDYPPAVEYKRCHIWVSLILDLLAAGEPAAEILENYPGLVENDILVCIAYGSEMSRERYVDIPLEAHA